MSAEFVFLYTTLPDLTTELRKRHPYSVPAMLVLPIAGGNDDYLAWARAQTGA